MELRLEQLHLTGIGCRLCRATSVKDRSFSASVAPALTAVLHRHHNE
jgi:hypothetical protein